MKGVSPLVAAVLLIALAVAVASILSSWMITLSKEKTTNIGNKTTRAVDCTAANIDIKDVYVDFNTNTSRTIVWNSGQIDLIVESASLYNRFGENATVITNLSFLLSVGEMKTIIFNLTNVLNSCENFSQVIVSTNCPGISDRFTGTPKGC